MWVPSDYISLVLGLAMSVFFAIFFHRAGEFEYEKGWLLGIASFALSISTYFGLKLGVIGIIAGQALLFLGMWIYNLRRHP